MDKIILNQIKLYAYHGCLAEEAAIGSEYIVNLSVEADLGTSAQTDQLNDTVDYVSLNKIVKDEMAIRSALLEHVAKRILDRIMADFPLVQKTKIEVAKINPPIGGNVASVSVKMKTKRKVNKK